MCLIWKQEISEESYSRSTYQIRSVTQSCPTLCDPMNRSTPGLPVHHQLLEITETHVHRVSDAIQPSHPLSSPSPLAPSPSQHQSLFQWVNSSHDRETMETETDFIFLGSKVTADGDCSHEIKRHLLLGRTVMTNLDNILKSRDITLPTKVHLDKAMVFPVVMYGCESWTIKKAEHGRIDAFELWFWRRLLKIPWTAQRSTSPSWRKSFLNIHWKDWCWSWSSDTLAPWCEELTHLKDPDREKLKTGGGGDDRGWDGWMASPTQWTWVWVNSGSWWWTGNPGMLQSMGS